MSADRPQPPAGPGLDDQAAATTLGETVPMIQMFRKMGMSWHHSPDGTAVETWSSGALVGRQPINPDGTPTGIPTIIINELTDEEIAARDSR